MLNPRVINVSQILTAEERFWPKVNIKSDNECWNWVGAKVGGYGCIRINGTMFYTHRVSWIIYNKKEIPYGMLVLHKCDNRGCVNPKHLYIGNHGNNISDRETRCPISPSQMSIFYESDIQLMRKLHNIEKVSVRNIAKIFKCSHSAVFWHLNNTPLGGYRIEDNKNDQGVCSK